MKINVGDYVRTRKGIARIVSELNDGYDYMVDKYLEINYDTNFIYKEDIIKSSPDIKKLIEVGDYVNGYKVYRFNEGLCIFGTDYAVKEMLCYQHLKIPNLITLLSIQEEKFFKSIVTKEEFEEKSYKL